MTKEELKTEVEAKKGFHSIITDALAQDHIEGDPIEKRYFYVNHTNAKGTMGKTFIFYLLDTGTNEAWFYNVEPEKVDIDELGADGKKQEVLEAYLKTNFNAYFLIRIDYKNDWAEVDTFKHVSGNLESQKVLVFKQDGKPVSHFNII